MPFSPSPSPKEPTSPRRLPRLGGLIAAAVLTLLPSAAWSGDQCNPSAGNYPATDGRNDYRINVGHFNTELGLTTAQTYNVVGFGAATWNMSGRSGYFINNGTTTFEGAGDFCGSTTGWNLVTMRAHASCAGGARGFVTPQCGGTQWWMNICPGINWSTVGDPGNGEVDLIQTIAHEFGHLTGLGHPDNDFCSTGGSVMCGTAWSNQQTRQRDIYPWDIECQFEFTDARDIEVVAVPHINGSFQSPVSVPPATAYKGHPAVRWTGGINWSRVHHRDQTTYTRLSSYLGITSTATLFNSNIGENGGAPSMVWWPETSTVLRSIYHRPTNTTKSWTQLYGLRQSILATDLTSNTFDWLRHCTNSSTPCSNTVVASGYRAAHAWNDLTSNSMTAWVRHNRLTNAADRELLISHGVPGAVLAQPEVTGVKSVVAPAMACRKGEAAESYDCMIAYVPYTDPSAFIRFRMFTVSGGGSFTWRGSEVMPGAVTYLGMALWYQDGYWYFSYNHPNTSNAIVNRSTDGLSWSFVTHHGLTVQAPAVASPYTGNANYLFLTR